MEPKMNKIPKVYDILLNEFGAQGWWPVTPSCCTDSFKKPIYGVKTRTNKQRFEIIIGAILTQNTSWKNVEKAIENLNKANLIDVDNILKLELKRLAMLIRPSGYFNQKAERLKIIANFIKDYGFDNLKKTDTSQLREKLLDLKGIGSETADSILLYAFDRPIFVIDAYTKRIFERLGHKAKSYDEWQTLFMDNLPKDISLFNEYHALLVELAKRNCKKIPICLGCPIKNMCVQKQKSLNN